MGSERASLADRRANALAGEVEEARALLDSAERGKRQTEAELSDSRSAVNEMGSINSRANSGKRALETSLGELENRLKDANDAAMRGGKSAMAKLESRIRELEIELGNVQSKTGENMKAHQRSEREIKELQFQNEEDRKNQDRMSDLASKLQQKIGTYKKQIEEAEEIAALNLAKFRKAQQELEETEDRARMAENALHAA